MRVRGEGTAAPWPKRRCWCSTSGAGRLLPARRCGASSADVRSVGARDKPSGGSGKPIGGKGSPISGRGRPICGKGRPIDGRGANPIDRGTDDCAVTTTDNPNTTTAATASRMASCHYNATLRGCHTCNYGCRFPRRRNRRGSCSSRNLHSSFDIRRHHSLTRGGTSLALRDDVPAGRSIVHPTLGHEYPHPPGPLYISINDDTRRTRR